MEKKQKKRRDLCVGRATLVKAAAAAAGDGDDVPLGIKINEEKR